MLRAITEVVNRVSTAFNNDPFMSILTLNRSLKHKVRRTYDKPLKYGVVKPCDQGKKRDMT